MSTSDLTYDQLMAMVYAIPPLHPTGVARALLGTLVALIAINTVTITLRIYSRVVLSRGAFGVDDMLASSGYICYTVATAFAIQGCYYGLGTRDADLPSQLYMIRGAELLLWWQIPYVISIPLIKSAIAAQIMRLTPSLYYRIPLWFVIGGSTFNALAGLVAALVHCKPISASWTGQGTCSSNVPLLDLSYLFTAIAIVADFTCALVPFFLIRGLNMNPRRKWSLVGVLSVGVGAGIFTIVRVPFFKHYLIAEDALYYQGYIAMWSMLEEGVGMFAASLPSMRKLFSSYYGSSNKSGNGNLGPAPAHGTFGAGGVGVGLNRKGHSGRGASNGGGGGYKDAIDADATPLNTLHPTAKRGQFSATVSAAAGGAWGNGGSWEVLDDEDDNRQGITIQRDVFLQSGNTGSKRNTASIPETLSGSDDHDLRYGK
ncbi:hypothetical protein SBRCBS47491_008069 [Sporothrix bragantina]|uniref:Rhodopsin domain-containing protein n=1 Tax=Sporothrix bragantina TaxID=671064 RepID=A0ABP0CIX7_9PEZI